MQTDKATQHPATTMTPATVPPDPGDGYKLVKNLIFDQVHKFRHRFGGEFDELVGEAHVAFVKSHNQFLTGKTVTGLPFQAPYATVIRRCVWYNLFDTMRTRVRRQKAAPMVSIEDGQDFHTPDNGLNVSTWVEELGTDARYAVTLVLEPPAAVEETIQAKGGEPRNYRSTVRTYLAAEGWSTARINAAFEEIRKALG